MRSMALLGIVLFLASAQFSQAQVDKPGVLEGGRSRDSGGIRGLVPRETIERLQRLPQDLNMNGRQTEQYRPMLRQFARQYSVPREGSPRDQDRAERRERRERPERPGRVERERASGAFDDERFDRQATQQARRSAVIDEFLGQVKPLLEESQRVRLDEIRHELIGPTAPEALAVLSRLSALESELKLRPNQQQAFDKAAAELREALNPPPVHQTANEDEVLSEVEEALSSGEMDRLREIGKKYAPTVDASSEVERFVSAIEPKLDADQKRLLGEFAATALGGKSGDARGDLRRLIEAARRCELSREQETRLREIERRALERMRRERDSHHLVASEARQEVIDLLEPEQKRRLRGFLREERQEQREQPRVRRQLKIGSSGDSEVP